MSIQALATLLLSFSTQAVPPPPSLPPVREVAKPAWSGKATDPVAVPPPKLPATVLLTSPEPDRSEPTESTVSGSTPSVARDALLSDHSAPRFGVRVAAGVPEGLGASLVYRPWRALRLHAGGLTGLASAGASGGLTFAPLFTALAPTIGVEAGFLSRGDLTPALRWVAGDLGPEGLEVDGAYRFLSAHLGLEFGSPRRFVFYLRAGLSRVEADLTGAPTVVGTGEASTRIDPGNMTLRLTMPSASAGFVLYL